MKIARHSPSSLNLFCASPALFVMERMMGRRQPVGAAAHRGTAVEAGIAAGLMEPARPVEECVEVADLKYRSLIGLCSDPNVEAKGKDIPAMVTLGLEELRPYGIPTSTQGFVEWKPEGLLYPIVGFYDFAWEQHGILIDLKTTAAMPSEVKIGHARQVALYAGAKGDNIDPRLTYITPKKRATYRLENVREHRDALYRMALTCERFLALSDDPAFFVSITAPDYEHFYWSSPASRHAGFEIWGV